MWYTTHNTGKTETMAKLNIISLSDIPSSSIAKSMNINFDTESNLNTNLTNLSTITTEQIPSDEEDAMPYLSEVNIASRNGNRRKLNSIVEDRNEDDEKRSRLETDLVSVQTTKGDVSNTKNSSTNTTPDEDIIIVFTDDSDDDISVENIENDADIENIHIVDGIIFVDCSQIQTTTCSVNNEVNDIICPPVETNGTVTIGAEDDESSDSDSSTASESNVDDEEGGFQDIVHTPGD